MKKRIFAFSTILLLACSLILLTNCEEPPESPDADVTKSPVFGISEGTYNKDIEVTISCPTEEAIIYYTLDGTEPGTVSLIYSAAIPVTGDGNNLLIKAVAKCQDMSISGIASSSFTISYLDLIIQASVNGTVTPSGIQKAAIDNSINITAAPDSGYAFSHWSVEDGTGITIDDIYSASTSVILAETGGMVQANFALALSLTVSSDGNGTTTPDGVVEVAANNPRSILALPAAGCQFDYWSVESGSGVTFGDVNSSETNVTLSNSDAKIQAKFTVWPQVDKLLADDGAVNDYFGSYVSISGDYAVIGVPSDDDNGSDSGSAYIFYRNGTSWQQQAKLTASDGESNDSFGQSVSISNDYAVIGARFDDDNGDASGSVYIFYRNGSSWSQQVKLTADDGAAEDGFGNSVSISGDYIVIGSAYDDIKGSAYIFFRSGTSWLQQAKLIASDGADSDSFGSSVSISGDYTIIGTPRDDDSGRDSGSAYIFYRSGTSWLQQAKLNADDGAIDDLFSNSVSISDDYAVIGAIQDDDKGSNSGSVYIFQRSITSWSQQAKLTAFDGEAGDKFSESVSISGDYIVIGATYDDDKGSYSGSAYIFNRIGTSWLQQTKLTATDGVAEDYFGTSVYISGDYVVVGSFGDDDNGSFSGSAYIFGGE